MKAYANAAGLGERALIRRRSVSVAEPPAEQFAREINDRDRNAPNQGDVSGRAPMLVNPLEHRRPPLLKRFTRGFGGSSPRLYFSRHKGLAPGQRRAPAGQGVLEIGVKFLALGGREEAADAESLAVRGEIKPVRILVRFLEHKPEPDRLEAPGAPVAAHPDALDRHLFLGQAQMLGLARAA